MLSLILAQLLFAGGHVLLSSPWLRPRLVGLLGPKGFRVGYSSLSVIGLVWLIIAYGNAPFVPLWDFGVWPKHLALLLVPIGFVLVVFGVSAPGATSVGGESVPVEKAVAGASTISRHNMLSGVVLWGVAHLLANGDVAALILFGGITIMCVIGMISIDHRRAETMGAERWGAIAARTSRIPFAAILAGRTRLDWRGIGWWRPLLGLALGIGAIWAHGAWFGLPVWPG